MEPAHHHPGEAVLAEIAPNARALRAEIPATWRAFTELHQAAFAPGALDLVTKELIALALSVIKGCDGCMAAHAKGAARAGATAAQVAEALGVAISMDGGPATSHGPVAFGYFTDFASQHSDR